MTTNEWIKLVERRESALWVSLVCEGGSNRYFRESLEWNVSIASYKYSNDTHMIRLDSAMAIQDVINNTNNGICFYKDYQNRCEAEIENLSLVGDKILADLKSNRAMENWKLAELADDYFEATRRLMPFLASLVLVQDKLEGEIRADIARELGEQENSEAVADFLQKVIIGDDEAAVVLESRALWAIAAWAEEIGLSIVENTKATLARDASDEHRALRHKIDAHIEEYGWLRTFTYLGDPFSHEEILDRLNILMTNGNARSHVRTLSERDNAKRLSVDAKLSNLTNQARAKIKPLLEIAGAFQTLRFKRVDCHFSTEVRIRKLFELISDRLGTRRQRIIYMTAQEINSGLAGGNTPTDKELEQRTEGFSVIVTDGRIKLILEKRASNRSADSVPDFEFPIRGTTAYNGFVEGKARIILSPKDSAKILGLNDILVTPMTTPHLMGAIEKASAIITDEGGLLCHAAIISRELEIPCIIGTGFASQVLEDDGIYLVDALDAIGTVAIGRAITQEKDNG